MRRSTMLWLLPMLFLCSACGASDATTPRATALPVPQPSATAPVTAAAPLPTPAPTPVPPTPLPDGPLAPELTGGGSWLNSEPLTLAELRGKVVLVNFWTYGCYNCQNTLPAMREWWAKYRDQGLVIVGVHTPEFARERELENVRQATIDEEMTWPVVQDNDWQIWRAYRNRYWPRFYLVDHRGVIVYDHIGEGAYEETDRRIAAALAAAMPHQ